MKIGKSFKLYLLGTFSAIGGFLFGYHTGVISGVLIMTDFRRTMGLIEGNATSAIESSTASAINGGIVGVLLAGCFLGSLIGGYTSDVLSRRWSIFIFSIIFTISGAIQAGATGLIMLMISRFCAGISIGALSMIVPIYHSEIATNKTRGRLITLQQWAITIGIAMSFWINYGKILEKFSSNKGCNILATHSSRLKDGIWEWRIPLAIQVIPSIILAIGICFCPYSPRWLISKKREKEAADVLKTIRSGPPNLIDEEIAQMKKDLDDLHKDEIKAYHQLLKRPMLHPFLLGIGIQIFQQLTGINSTMYYAPRIFQDVFPNTTQALPLLVTGVNGCINVLATIPTLLFIDKLGRRILLIIGAIIMSIAMLVVAILIANFQQKHFDETTGSSVYILNNNSVAWIIIVFIYIFVAGFAFSWGPIAWIYCTEIYPLRMRAKANSITTAANWATNTCVSFLVPIMLEHIRYGTFIIFSIFCAIMTGFIYLFYPETKDVPLEHSSIHNDKESFIPDWIRNKTKRYKTFENSIENSHGTND